MKFSNGMSLRSTVLAAVALGLLAGCEQTKRSSHLYFFPEQTKVANSMDAQIDAGARADATLYPMHFDGAELNSLGMAKVMRIASTSSDSSVVVYLDMSADEQTKARHDSVAGCMEHCGRDAAKFKLVDGPNPGTSTSTGGLLARMSKTETGGDTGGGAAAPASGGMPAAATK